MSDLQVLVGDERDPIEDDDSSILACMVIGLSLIEESSFVPVVLVEDEAGAIPLRLVELPVPTLIFALVDGYGGLMTKAAELIEEDSKRDQNLGFLKTAVGMGVVQKCRMVASGDSSVGDELIRRASVGGSVPAGQDVTVGAVVRSTVVHHVNGSVYMVTESLDGTAIPIEAMFNRVGPGNPGYPKGDIAEACDRIRNVFKREKKA